MSIHSRHHGTPGQRPGPPDLRDAACPYPMGGLPESPRHDWAKVSALLEDLINDDAIRQGTYDFLTNLYEQLDSRGSLSDTQVERIYEVEARRNRADGRSF